MLNGFLLGKFMPPHEGHVFLCKTAMRLCDRLTVLVCTLPDDPIPGDLRHQWMKSLLPGATIVYHDAMVPQEPKDQPDFWPIWRTICRAAHDGPIDRVFGSEPYIRRLAAELGARPVMIDPDRVAVPISATAIRMAPFTNWRFVPGAVRPFYQKRVVLFGAESTGKTTLAKALADWLKSPYVPEYGRVYDANRPDGPWQVNDFAAIMAGHRAMRAAIPGNAGPVLDLHRFRSGLLRAILAIKEAGYGSNTRASSSSVMRFALRKRAA